MGQCLLINEFRVAGWQGRFGNKVISTWLVDKEIIDRALNQPKMEEVK